MSIIARKRKSNLVITTCGNSEKIAKNIAKKLNAKFSPLTIASFPDGDIYVKFNTPLKNKKLIIIQSFQPHPDMSLFDIIFAAQTAKDLGAKKVILVAPYLAYMRQDKRFHPGEAISSKIMAKHLNICIDKIITIDPHLHRYKSLKDIFTISTKRLTANSLIIQYIKKNIRNAVIIGPDWESFQWAERIAQEVGCASSCLAKTRYSSRRVRSKMIHPIECKGKNAILIDDIISTGKTMIEAAKKAKKLKAKSITAIGVHGLFVENAHQKMKKHITKVITTNCIKHPTNKIDVTPLLIKELEKEA